MHLTSSLILACATLSPAAPQAACAHEQATLVKGRAIHQGRSYCSRTVKLFGAQMSSFGSYCPHLVIRHPERHACLGEPAVGYRCAQVGFVSITAQRCRCISAGDLDWLLGGDRCQCSTPATIGTLVEAKTLACKGGN